MILKYSVHHWTMTVLILLFTAVVSTGPAAADQPPNQRMGSEAKEATAPTTGIGLFQSIISKADGDRCPMYPSCSHYAAQAIERHGRLTGWVLAAERLLRCGRDETRLAPTVIANGQRLAYDPLEANTFWWKWTQK